MYICIFICRNGRAKFGGNGSTGTIHPCGMNPQLIVIEVSHQDSDFDFELESGNQLIIPALRDVSRSMMHQANNQFRIWH